MRWRYLKAFVFVLLILFLLPLHFCLALNKEFMYDNPVKRDPFLSLIGEDVELAEIKELTINDLVLEGIIFDPEQGSLAVINGEVYRPFEFIGGFEIQEITQTLVRISKDYAVFTLKIITEDE